MTPGDKTALKQLEDIVYAPGATASPEACQTTLGKAQKVVATVTSEDGRKNAQYYLTELNNTCARKPDAAAPAKFDPVAFIKSPVGMALAGGAVIVMILVLTKS